MNRYQKYVASIGQTDETVPQVALSNTQNQARFNRSRNENILRKRIRLNAVCSKRPPLQHVEFTVGWNISNSTGNRHSLIRISRAYCSNERTDCQQREY